MMTVYQMISLLALGVRSLSAPAPRADIALTKFNKKKRTIIVFPLRKPPVTLGKRYPGALAQQTSEKIF